MKPSTAILTTTTAALLLMGCASNNGNNGGGETAAKAELTEQQDSLMQHGWQMPATVTTGELTEQYGIRNRYGQQDNWFDIAVGEGLNVAVKVVDAATDECIRYVYVAENSSETINQIPPGQYYLKLAYGHDWMEQEQPDGRTVGKFTRDAMYERSTDAFDFGVKHSTAMVNYSLEIKVSRSAHTSNFRTQEIDEATFLK